MMRRLELFAAAAILILLVPTMARADSYGYSRSIGWGPVIGVTADPDQFRFGAQMDLGDIAPRLRFQPNFEVGVGDNETVGGMSFETEYQFDTSSQWSPYLGGGIGLSVTGHDDRNGFNGSDTNAGLTVIGGLERVMSSGNSFFLESKLGLIDAPDLEVSVGWTFYH